ncbi:hypothetical protein BKA62DRAFT_707216 [Auriculariales sp. MPI-PUGE-AT-0066]|nr:hypothetical protein BKA62DRAFT_707216 [Auriculariales sp. MPI-PUGE-AT-0066]
MSSSSLSRGGGGGGHGSQGSGWRGHSAALCFCVASGQFCAPGERCRLAHEQFTTAHSAGGLPDVCWSSHQQDVCNRSGACSYTQLQQPGAYEPNKGLVLNSRALAPLHIVPTADLLRGSQAEDSDSALEPGGRLRGSLNGTTPVPTVASGIIAPSQFGPCIICHEEIALLRSLSKCESLIFF